MTLSRLQNGRWVLIIFLLSLLILNILEKKYQKQKLKGNEKRDVKFHMSSTAQNKNDVNRKKKEHGTESKETKRQSTWNKIKCNKETV